MTDTEKLYKICILDLLIAIDEDVVDWRDHPKLWTAIQKADIAVLIIPIIQNSVGSKAGTTIMGALGGSQVELLNTIPH
jgi:hypothetical protein